jgi:AraC-like DNA-binding protein/mannose-6-phosphate isomerase-like protein (cupin superfamily)
MSKKRQPPRKPTAAEEAHILVRSFAVRHTSPRQIPQHAHDWHQLIYASEGVMWVHTAHGEWVVPPNRAVWVPAGVEHGIEMSGIVFVQTLYFSSEVVGELPDRCCAVNVSPLLRELIRHTIGIGLLDCTIPAQANLAAFLVDQMGTLPMIPLQLPLPSDERARRAAAWMREHPEHSASLKQIAKRVSASVRTLERLFQKETGMTFGKWRQQLRLLHALRLLAAGRSVTAASLAVGYDSASAFIAAFRKFFGTTPARYFD